MPDSVLHLVIYHAVFLKSNLGISATGMNEYQLKRGYTGEKLESSYINNVQKKEKKKGNAKVFAYIGNVPIRPLNEAQYYVHSLAE